MNDSGEWTLKHTFLFCSSLENISVPSSVKMIGDGAFRGCTQLEHVELKDGLEHIGNDAFRDCTSLKTIVVPCTVKVIGDRAFRDCTALKRVVLHEGSLQQLGKQIFRNCISLECIHIPCTVKALEEKSFSGCVKLTEVNLSEGLRKINNDVFCRCLSLKRMKLPSTVYSIHKRAFSKCPKLVAVMFSDKIKELVCYPENAPRDWWNEGVPKHTLRTYFFLAASNIPKRLRQLRVTKWRILIENMLKNIPSISSKQLDAYHGSIAAKLAVYERLQKIAPLLELAIWKAKLVQECDANSTDLSSAMKLEHRINCGASVIIPNVVSFLLMDRLPRKSVL